MPPVSPSPLVLLSRRIVTHLRETATPGIGSTYEPDWNAALIQRVLGAVSEVILDSVAHGEEVQLGRLGVFFPKILDERVVVSNLPGVSEKHPIPRRAKMAFVASQYADSRMTDFMEFLSSVETTANSRK